MAEGLALTTLPLAMNSTALCKGVSPHSVRAFGSAPACRSLVTTKWPARCASRSAEDRHRRRAVGQRGRPWLAQGCRHRQRRRRPVQRRLSRAVLGPRRAAHPQAGRLQPPPAAGVCADEAYRKYGLRATRGTTNLAIYRALVRQYPDLDRRQILLDLIEIRGDKGKWFAAAKDEGFLDIALECAGTHGADPSTLVRAARDFGEAEPRFAASVALMAIGQLLGGGGYNPPLSDAEGAVAYLFTAAQRIGATGWARRELARLGQEPCSPGRELFQDTVRAALFHHDGTNSAD